MIESVTWKCSSFVLTALEDSPSTTSTEAGSFLFDLAAGDGEEEAGTRFFPPLLGPGRRGGGMVMTAGPPEWSLGVDNPRESTLKLLCLVQDVCSVLLTVTQCNQCKQLFYNC